MPTPTLTDVPHLRAGHWTHPSGTTGTTVILFPDSATGSVWVPGSATGSREMGVLSPGHLAGHVHGICLSGGSAFGLAAADGVMEVLEAEGIGFSTPHGLVPIVPAAILFDLHTATARPDREAGRLAALAADRSPLAEGRVGAGAGARVGMAGGGPEPGGIGTWAQRVEPWTIGVVAAVNAVGSIRDPETGAWVAGRPLTDAGPETVGDWRQQTTLVLVATDAPLNQAQLGVIARMATAGMARTIFPAFTPFDGDVVFAVSTTNGSVVETLQLAHLGHVAATCVARAIVRAVQHSGEGT